MIGIPTIYKGSTFPDGLYQTLDQFVDIYAVNLGTLLDILEKSCLTPGTTEAKLLENLQSLRIFRKDLFDDRLPFDHSLSLTGFPVVLGHAPCFVKRPPPKK